MTPSKKSWYELSEELLMLDSLLELGDVEWTEEHAEREREYAVELAAKTDSYGKYLAYLEDQEENIAKEEARLKARHKALANRVKRLKGYAIEYFQRTGQTKAVGTLWTLSLRKNPPSVVVEVDPDKLATEYQRVIPETIEANKIAILADMKLGKYVEGARFADISYTLQYK